MNKILEEINKSIQNINNPNLLEIISIILSIIIPVSVLFIQRYLDNKRTEEEKEPMIALGDFKVNNVDLIIEKYFGTEISIKDNPFYESQIKIPIFNIGKTPVYNVQVEYKIENLNEIRETLAESNKTLKISETDQIYLHESEDDGKFIYHIFKYSPEISSEYVYRENGQNIHKKINGFKHETIKGKDYGRETLNPILPSEKVNFNFKSDLEIFIQYVLYMNNFRNLIKEEEGQCEIPDLSQINSKGEVPTVLKNSISHIPRNVDPVIPELKFDISFIDYKNKPRNITKYMYLVSGTHYTVKHFGNDGVTNNTKLNWSILAKIKTPQ